jgi:hypothetical protein
VTGTLGTCLSSQALIRMRDLVLQAAASEPSLSALPGGFALRRRGQGQVIADSRPFVQGDDLRHIDRGATARTGTLHVRRFHEDRDRVCFLVADFRPSMLWGMRRAFRSVAAAEALCWIGWQAVEAGGRVGLLAATAERTVIVPTRPGLRGMLSVIGGMVQAHDEAIKTAMARARTRARRKGGTATAGQSDLFAEPTLGQAVAGLSRVVPRGADVVLATALDSAGEAFDAWLGDFSQHRHPQFLLIEDGALHDLPAGHYPLRGADGSRRDVQFSRRAAASVTARVDARAEARAQIRVASPANPLRHDLWRIDAGLPVQDAMRQAQYQHGAPEPMRQPVAIVAELARP